LRASDKKSVFLVGAGAIIGFYSLLIDLYKYEVEIGNSSEHSLQVIVSIGLIMAFGILMFILFGLGIVARWDKESKTRNRWRKDRLKVGILNDMNWEAGGKGVAVGTDVSPEEWKIQIESIAQELSIGVNVEYIDNKRADFDTFVAILNPYGEVYPELNVRTLSSLRRIISYDGGGGLFVNVAGIPSYYAYNSMLKRFVDTTQAVFASDVDKGVLSLIVTRPFQLTPLMQEMGLQVVSFKSGFACNINEILGRSGMVGLHEGQLTLRRAVLIESNMDSCIFRLEVNMGDKKQYVTPLFFASYGNGDLLISLVWINDEYHDDSNKRALKYAISKLMLTKLNERKALIVPTH